MASGLTGEKPAVLAWPIPRLVLVGELVALAVLWPFSGWAVWPWVFGLGALLLIGAVLGVLGARERVGPMWIIAVSLVIVIVFLLGYVDTWVFGIAAGLILALFGIAGLTDRAAVPRWAWLTALIAGPALLIACTVFYTVNAVQLAQQQERAEQAFHDYQVSKILPRPRGATLQLIQAIGFNESSTVEHVCLVFTEQAKQQFAAAHGAEDCAGAIANMHAQVRDPGKYVNAVWIPNQATRTLPDGKTTILDACHLEWGNFVSGDYAGVGPQIGYLTFVQQYDQGSYLTEYRPCSAGR